MRDIEVSAEIDEPPDSLPEIHSIVTVVARHLMIDEWQLSFLFCDDQRIAVLNKEYRGVDGPTDVLSFAASEHPQQLLEGDIAISIDSVRKNAEIHSVDEQVELVRVIVHALLHLGGFEHEGVTLDSDEAAHHPMLGLQESIVREITSHAGENTVE